MTNSVLIAGGGIGGLAAAAALAGRGIASTVVERGSEFAEIGAGIQLGPNGFHSFDALGIGPQMRETAVFIDALRLMDAQTADLITEIPLTEAFRAHFGNPYAVVHRAQLHALLLERCRTSGRVTLLTDHAATGYSQDGTSVRLHLKDRPDLSGRALIGAEGLRSPIRAQMLDDGPPRVSGHTTYRSVIPRDVMPDHLRQNAATLWAGPKCHIVHYPLTGGTEFNLVVTYHRNVDTPVSGKPVTNEEVAVGFEHVHPDARAVIEHGQNWKLWVLCDRDPGTQWVDGRVALLGDAAHPMLQYFAQGACMAMEDGVALAVALEAEADIDRALQLYQDMRLTRTARVQMNSRLIGDYIYHPDATQAAVRNEIMQSMTPQDWYDRLTWIYRSNGLPPEMGGILMSYVFDPAPRASVEVAGGDARFPVRRIFCVGRNYAAHAREMGHDDREPPFFFTKPADAVIPDGTTIPYPPGTSDLHYEAELIVAIGTGGADIAEAQALDHVYGYACGNDLTRRDLQAQAKKAGRPWDMAKGFDRSAVIGPIRPVASVGHLDGAAIRLTLNGEERQTSALADMIWSVPEIIAYLSGLVALAPGDLIMTGTPAGVGAMGPGDTAIVSITGLPDLGVTIEGTS